MTGSAMNDSRINGSEPAERPRLFAAASRLRWALKIVSSGASDISPATGSGSFASTRPEPTATYPPPQPSSASTAFSISWSLSPATMRLCESWPTVVAIAPFLIGSPLITPMPTRPDAWCRSSTAILVKPSLAANRPFSAGTSATCASVISSFSRRQSTGVLPRTGRSRKCGFLSARCTLL